MFLSRPLKTGHGRDEMLSMVFTSGKHNGNMRGEFNFKDVISDNGGQNGASLCGRECNQGCEELSQ